MGGDYSPGGGVPRGRSTTGEEYHGGGVPRGIHSSHTGVVRTAETPSSSLKNHKTKLTRNASFQDRQDGGKQTYIRSSSTALSHRFNSVNQTLR